MIRSIEIKGLRGIREGKLDDLAPLTILVGPNGSGKSTVLDALMIGASDSPGDAIVQCVQRRVGVLRGAWWLLWRPYDAGTHSIEVSTGEGRNRVSSLHWEGGAPDAIALKIAADEWFDLVATASFAGGHTKKSLAAVQSKIGVGQFGVGPQSPQSRTFTGPPKPGDILGRLGVPSIRMVDAHLFNQPTPLHELYSRAVKQGRKSDAKPIAGELVPNLVDMEILTEDNAPVLHLVFRDYSVPAVLAGDGIQMVLRLSLELASRPDGLVLLEEPEVHQHPGAIRQTARVIIAAVKRGIQIVLTTHSLELIDALLLGQPPEILDQIAVYRVRLNDGVLKNSRLTGTEAAHARAQIEEDLR